MTRAPLFLSRPAFLVVLAAPLLPVPLFPDLPAMGSPIAATTVTKTASTTVGPVRTRPPIDVANGLDAWNSDIERRATRDPNLGPEEGYTECAEVVEIPRAFLCATISGVEMNAALGRASMFIEGPYHHPKRTVPRNDDPRFARVIRDAGGHDLRSDDLLAYWRAMQEACAREKEYCPERPEAEMFETFILPLARRTKQFVLVSYALQGPVPFLSIVTHEILHAQFFLQPLYRSTIEGYWRGLPQAQRDAVRALLAPYYDATNEFLVVNEFQAYVLMNHADTGLLEAVVALHRPRLLALLREKGIAPVQVGHKPVPEWSKGIR